MKIDICSTAYNEVENLTEFINEFKLLKSCNSYIGDLVLVNNGSTDSSKDLIKQLDFNGLKVFSLEKNQRFGGGMKFSIQSSNAKFVALFPADNQYSFTEASKMIDFFISAKLKNQKVMVKGQRIKRSDPIAIRFLSRLYSSFISILIGQKVIDVNGLPKIFEKSDFLEILGRLPDDASFDAALLREATVKGYVIKEMEISYMQRKHGPSSWVKGRFIIGFKMVFSMLKYRLHSVR